MYRENSSGDGKQRLEELFRIIFDSFVANSYVVKVVWISSAADNCLERISRAVRTDDNFTRTDSPSRSNG